MVMKRSTQEAADAAVEAAIQPAPFFDPADLVMNDPEREVIKATQARSMVWLYSPAMLKVLTVAYARLLKVVEIRGMKTEQLFKVRGALLKSKREVYLWPVDEDDPLGIPLNSYGSAVWINLISLLGNTKLVSPTGYRDRYQATIAPQAESPVGPALLIRLGQRLERQTKPDAKTAETTDAQSAKTKAANKQSSLEEKQAPNTPTA
jgi:hypothetical protein